ncbi:DUF6924 domain-containing protein [Streptomyces sp. NPDC001177]
MTGNQHEPIDDGREAHGRHLRDDGVTRHEVFQHGAHDTAEHASRADGALTATGRELPRTVRSLAIRTDFSSQETWQELRAALLPLDDLEEPGAYLHILEYPAFGGLTSSNFTSLAGEDEHPAYLILFDREAMTSPEHLVLVLDLQDEPGRTIRVPARHLAAVEANLFLANMDFGDFADAADEKGVYRG